MKLICRLAVILSFSLMVPGNRAAEDLPLDEHLAPLKPLLGKTWRGEFKNSTPEKSQVDVARWERALNGKAIRVLHSINDGVYGGETLIFYDAAKKQVVFFYFTTAGFNTIGTMTLSDGKLTSVETISGNANGVTEVRGTGTLRADGTFHSKSQYLKEGTWTDGHEVLYKEAPHALVVFK